MFLVLYIALTVLLESRMKGWNPNTPGACFEGNIFLRPKLGNPSGYRRRLIFMSLLVIFPLISSIIGSSISLYLNKRSKDHVNTVFFLLAFSLIVVHVNFFRVLRTRDQHFLVESESENEWTFGQIIIMFSILPMLVEFWCAFWDI
jgi:hypothetical protein